MSDDRKDPPPEDPAKQLVQGLGLLFRAAKGAAANIKKEVETTSVGKSLEDAGRELARAANNVVEHLAAELSGNKKSDAPHEAPPPDAPPAAKAGDDDEFDGVKPTPKPTGPTPADPGFRIMVDDDDPKPKS